MKKIFLVPLLLTTYYLLLTTTFAAQDSGIYTYQFHLYFDNGKLVKDRDFDFAFDLIAQEYQPPVDEADYRGEILSVRGVKIADFNFSLGGVTSTGRGKVSVLAPYFDNAQTAIFYNPSDRQLLSVDVAPFGPVCNEDGFCNADVGEDSQNCPADCAVTTPSPTISPLLPKQFLILGLTLSQALTWLGLIILALLIIWFVLKWLAKKRATSANIQPPQNVPPPPQI